MAATATAPLLELRDLRVTLPAPRGGGDELALVDGVDLELGVGRTLGLVGESGCGKSLTALSILRLLPEPPLRLRARRLALAGEELLGMRPGELRRVRGARVGMVFQEPMTSLNPVFACGEQVAEGLRLHLGLGRREAAARAVELLGEVGIDHPGRRAKQYPHELSGGMRQRVMVAAAIACGPELLVADEPTTALDVTIQARILELLDQLQRDRGMAILHITHDLAVIAERSHDVAVMYSGRVVEAGPTGEVFAHPSHPYTLGLLACRPRPGQARGALPVIPGQVPEPAARPSGCRFRDRCPFAVERCAQEEPALEPVRGRHRVACHEAGRVRAAAVWPGGADA